jgi:hypothetical protein
MKGDKYGVDRIGALGALKLLLNLARKLIFKKRWRPVGQGRLEYGPPDANGLKHHHLPRRPED